MSIALAVCRGVILKTLSVFREVIFITLPSSRGIILKALSANIRIYCCVTGLLLIGCEQNTPPPETLSVAELLGGTPVAGFQTADNIIPFQFPEDHGPHPAFRNEWWYFTGNLQSIEGKSFGYQVTFFRVGLIPPNKAPQLDSNWNQHTLWMAHIALTDVNEQQHYMSERLSRGGPGMAGANGKPLHVWLDDWQLLSSQGQFPWQISVANKDFELQLSVDPIKPIVLQGEQGLSRKSTRPGNASYYYSYPRMSSQGTLQLHDKQYSVSGQSWFDREWSTSALDNNQIGWDWFSLQLQDGSELMYYQIRSTDGSTHSSSQGKWIDPQGKTTRIFASDIQLEPQAYWQSKNGRSYPTQWILRDNKQHHWSIVAPVKEQLMNTTVEYWEGTVNVVDPKTQEIIGQGYLEMTGY